MTTHRGNRSRTGGRGRRTAAAGLLGLVALTGSTVPGVAPAALAVDPPACAAPTGHGWTAGAARLADPCSAALRDLGLAWR